MSIKITVPNTGADYLTFGSGNTPTAAQIGGYDDGSSNGHLEFYTTASGTSTEQVRITSAGNVGIGTSSPVTKLTMAGNISFSGSQALNWNMYSSGGDKYIANGYAAQFYYDPSAGMLRYLNASNNVSGAGAAASTVDRFAIDSSGNLLVGQTTKAVSVASICEMTGTSGLSVRSTGGASNTALWVWNNSDTGTRTQVQFLDGSGGAVRGTITTNGSTTSYNTSSDYRLKENIAPMTDALSVVQQLKPCTYVWKESGVNGQGFIAHELAEVVPDAVSGEKDAVDEEGKPVYQGIDVSFLVATLTAAIQEQQAMITSQSEQLSSQAAVITTLTERITALENK